MSLDRSLKSKNALVRHRNVLTRTERIALLQEQEKWLTEQSVFGLPKVAHRKVTAKKAAKEAAVAGEVPVEGAAPAEGAAAAAEGKAAAGARPAAGAKGAAAPAKAAPAAKSDKKADKK